MRVRFKKLMKERFLNRIGVENMGITVLDIAKLKKAPEEAYTPLEALIIYVK